MLASCVAFEIPVAEKAREQALKRLDDLRVHSLNLQVLCSLADSDGCCGVRLLEKSQKLYPVGSSVFSWLGRSVYSEKCDSATACAAQVIATCKRAIDEAKRLDLVLSKATMLPECYHLMHGQAQRIALKCCQAVALLAKRKGAFGEVEAREITKLKRFANLLAEGTGTCSENESTDSGVLSTSPFAYISGSSGPRSAELGRSSPFEMLQADSDAYQGWPKVAKPALIEFDTGFEDCWILNPQLHTFEKREGAIARVSTGDMDTLLPGSVGEDFDSSVACLTEFCRLESQWVLAQHSPASDTTHREDQVKWSPGAGHLVLTQKQISNQLWGDLTKLDVTVKHIGECIENTWSRFEATRLLMTMNTEKMPEGTREAWDLEGLIAMETFQGVQRMSMTYFTHYVEQEKQTLWRQLLEEFSQFQVQMLKSMEAVDSMAKDFNSENLAHQALLQSHSKMKELLEVRKEKLRAQCEEIHAGLGDLIVLANKCELYVQGVRTALKTTLT